MGTIKVLIVDDSAVIRSIIKEVLSHDPQIEVVGEAQDPYVAREKIKLLNPDIITLDVEMPKMDGITFLSNLMRLRPMPVIMLSTLTTSGADITFEALEIGALDFIAKPKVEDILANRMTFQELLIEKIKLALNIDQKSFNLSNSIHKKEGSQVLSFTGCKRSNHLIAIGASTGGTEAIKKFVKRLPSNSPPVVITLHIPKEFSDRFATRLNETCQVTVQEAKHGQKLKEGNVYVAPGDLHLKIAHKNGALFCNLDDSEPVNRHKPAVDVLFQSLVPIANNLQAILMTGMGQDGAKGMLELKQHGARTIIQNKSSSLIWGMPGRAHAMEAHTDELPLDDIAKSVLSHAKLTRDEMKEVIND